jgi:hypothetical protein
MIERTPRSYASVAYDILWIASLTENDIKTNTTHSDFNSLKKTFEKVANSYRGITGNTTLNTVGDKNMETTTFGQYKLSMMMRKVIMTAWPGKKSANISIIVVIQRLRRELFKQFQPDNQDNDNNMNESKIPLRIALIWNLHSLY